MTVRRSIAAGVFRAGAVFAAAAALSSAAVVPAAGQEDRDAGPVVSLTGWGGISIQEGRSSFGLGEDLVSFGARGTIERRAGLQPWLQADRFERPDLECVEGFQCVPDGWLLRAGVTVPFSVDESRPGVHPHLAVGIGAGFGDKTAFSYLGGFGLSWRLTPRMAPMAEVRLERVPGLRGVFTLNAGLRVGLF